MGSFLGFTTKPNLLGVIFLLEEKLVKLKSEEKKREF
jgi:hypothetical protein